MGEQKVTDKTKEIEGPSFFSENKIKEEKKKSPKKDKFKKKRKQVLRVFRRGRAYIQATYNNTYVSLTDLQGNVVAWSSAGKIGFKGPRKSTPYAASLVVKSLGEKIQEMGLKEVEVFLKGIGSGREAAVRALDNIGLRVILIKDITSIPHNGCRPPKVRRV